MPSKSTKPSKKVTGPKKVKTSRAKNLKGFKKVAAEVVEPTELHKDQLSAEAGGDLLDNSSIEIPQPAPLDENNRVPAAADPVTRYMAEIGRYPLLTREQEHALAVRFREGGDPKAAEALVTSNLRFVVKIAAEYTKFGAKLIDLVQEGNVGLMHAVKEFNPYKGVRLITYAVWWIRGYIQEHLMRQYSMVRIGTTATQRKLFYQLQREKERLERDGLELGIAQISGRLGIPKEDVAEMHSRISGRDVSLDAPIGDGTTRLMDFQNEPTSDNLVESLGTKEEVGQLMSGIDKLRPTLSEKENFLLEERLLADEPLTLKEIGDKYGTTREAVRQMEVRLIEKIKRAMED